MGAQRINSISGTILTALSLTALFDVLLLGYTRPPLPDEGMGAHIFQLSVLMLLPAGLIFLVTADWTQPVRNVKRLALPIAVLALAFVALYYLEHFYYSAHYPNSS